MTLKIKARHKALCGALFGASLLVSCASGPLPQSPQYTAERAAAERLSANEITEILEDAIKRFDTPGAALGIVYQGKVYYSGGAGLADIEAGTFVTPKTQFRIASTTKAFTAAALAVLVDEGLLNWDDKVIDHLPDFALADPWVTKEFTITDLLTHRSGLGLGAGDLMFWPEPSGFSRAEVTHNLRYFEPASSFRSKYAYDNTLYIVAGEIVAKVSEKSALPGAGSWEGVVQNRILDPIGAACYSQPVPQDMLDQTAIPYSLIDGKITEVTRNKISEEVMVWTAAGGLVCNVEGMNRWMLTQLSGGLAPNGTRIFSQDQRDEMWTSQTILRVRDWEREQNGTHFKTYALGWRKRDMHGYEVISHTGTLSGFQAQVTLVPELDLGIVILNNGANSAVRNSLTQTLLLDFMGRPNKDWVEYYAAQQEDARKRAEDRGPSTQEQRPVLGTVTYPLSQYAGTYIDPWFGQVTLKMEEGGLRFQSEKMIKMAGTLYPYDGHQFTLLWDDKEFRADAYMTFETDNLGRITGAKIAHIDDNGDWSFNFHDLNFSRIPD